MAQKLLNPQHLIMKKIENRLKRIWGLGENKVGDIVLALKEVM